MTNARFIVVLMLTLALAACVAQFAIDFSSENIAASCIVLASSMAILLYIHWTDAIRTHPLSTFAIFGFCVTTQLGALLAQSASWISLTQNLRQPLETFATLAAYQALALLAHAVYRVFHRPASVHRESLLRAVLTRLGLYATPSTGTLWIMGLFGLLAFLLGSGGASVGSKVSQGLTFVAWAPFLIPMYVLQEGPGYCNARRSYAFLAVYAAVIALLGIAANARGLMLSGLMTIGLFFTLSAMRSARRVNVSHIAKLGFLGIVVAALSIPVTDLVTAMVIARKSRGNVSTVKMVEETFYFLQQPQLLRAQQDRDKAISILSSYDEAYFASPLVARLVETKFHDNALYFSSRLNARDEARLLDITGDLFWAALPDPMLKAMRIDVDKQDLRFSMGDYISHLGGAGDLGGYRTGSGFAQGQAILGHLFPLIYLAMCPLLFWAHDLLAARASRGQVLVSALGMLGIWKLFQYGISAESLQALVTGVARGLPQNIVLFLLIYHASRLAARILGSLTGIPRPPMAVAV
jgi:hypothetical protein